MQRLVVGGKASLGKIGAPSEGMMAAKDARNDICKERSVLNKGMPWHGLVGVQSSVSDAFPEGCEIWGKS